MSKTMAEVLNEADEKWSKEVGVSTPAEWADYIAAALSAAGFGVVADAKAEALSEAADEMDSLERLSGYPEESCNYEENAAVEAYDNATNNQEWLRARATALRGDS